MFRKTDYATNPPFTKTELERLYKTPMSIRQISKATGVSFTTIRRFMKEYGIEARSYSDACTLALANPETKYLMQLAKRRLRASKIALSPWLYQLRQGIFPLLCLQRSNASCQSCGEAAAQMHHHPELATMLDTLIAAGKTPLEATVEIVADHYLGRIIAIPLCKRCHVLAHHKPS